MSERTRGHCPHCRWSGPWRLTQASAVRDRQVHIEREHPTEGASR